MQPRLSRPQRLRFLPTLSATNSDPPRAPEARPGPAGAAGDSSPPGPSVTRPPQKPRRKAGAREGLPPAWGQPLVGRAFSTRAPVAGHAAFSPTHPPPETPASQGCPGRGTMSEFQKRAVSQAQDTHRPTSKLGQAEATVQGAGLATQDTRCTGHRQATDVGTRRLSWGVRESGRCSGQEKAHLGRDGQATSTVLPHPPGLP